jgi:nitrate reductase gamma subunit
VLLGIIIVTGIIPTIWNMFGSAYDYRTTVSPWFRGLFTAHPDVAAVSTAPMIYQVHAIAAWAIWAVWPFTRLVHAWSYPLWYLVRPYVVYRSRIPSRLNEPGTSGRRWRRVGTRF